MDHIKLLVYSRQNLAAWCTDTCKDSRHRLMFADERRFYDYPIGSQRTELANVHIYHDAISPMCHYHLKPKIKWDI